jgi:hypothetical protein
MNTELILDLLDEALKLTEDPKLKLILYKISAEITVGYDL